MQDDYFQVDNSAIKHNGFFVNRGKLERMCVFIVIIIILFNIICSRSVKIVNLTLQNYICLAEIFYSFIVCFHLLSWENSVMFYTHVLFT